VHDGRPWGLNGPEFLELYAAVLLGLVALCFAVWSLPRLGRAGGREHRAEIGPYELAFLNGGANRVADTALAGLMEASTLRVSRTHEGSVHTTDGAAADEFQELVVDHHLRSGTEIVGMLRGARRAVRRSGRCEPIERRLRERGLIVSAAARGLVAALVALFPLLAAIGVVRAVHGAALGYPIGFLIVEIALTAVAWRFLAWLLAHPQLTAAGQAARHVDLTPVGDLVTDGPRSSRPEFGRASGRAATRVASGGIGNYPDKFIREQLRPTRTTTGAAGFGGGSSGGCGGGGGGGCGGGGA